MDNSYDENIANLQDALHTATIIIMSLKEAFECDPITFEFAGVDLDNEAGTFKLVIDVKVEG